jgi:hypothetical protein
MWRRAVPIVTPAASCRGRRDEVGTGYGASVPPLDVVVGVTVVVAVVVGGACVVVVVVSVVVCVGTVGVVFVMEIVVGVDVELFDESSPPPVMSSAAMTPATMIATAASTHGQGLESFGGGAPYPGCCGYPGCC